MNPIGESRASQHEGDSKFVSNLYDHNNAYVLRWSTYANPNDEIADLETQTSKFPIVHRHSRTHKGWETRSITFQDPSVRKILLNFLQDYPDFDPVIQDWTLHPPFEPLVHRWDAISDRDNALRVVPDSMDTWEALVAFLKPIVAPSLAKIAKLQAADGIDFRNMSHIFAPGTLVMAKFYGVDTVCRVVKSVLKPQKNMLDASNSWIFTVEFVDWSGEESGYRTTSLEVKEFKGVHRINTLPIFPISYLTEEAKIKESMIERGRKFERLRGYRLMACNGVRLFKDKNPEAGEAKDSDVKYEAEFSIAHHVDPRPKHISERNENLRKLTEEELLITTPWVHGFDLKTKHWGLFCVDDLYDVTWNDKAFDKLILPNSEKEMALAFVKGKQRSNDSSFDDFIQNKGRGLIILMFGPPGVGKTFTAEAVAEKSKVALYAMSAGDLGTKPSDVEKNLEQALELCSMWDAILLLDEADVFLAARTSDSPERNEFVSIFLRMMEYYTGILFLTTNRVESIDHAFQSRIDLFLPYNDLSKQARRHVWEGLLARLGHTLDVTEEALDNLSELHLNGREIKNIVKSAHMLRLGSDDDQTSPSDHLYSIAKNRIQALEPLNE
ncbi:P-loop containing nucleoside triphosphate hydrolase protein [Hypoxylon sp. EC38]|nr:P-loop containing nucleoside triphosphate hydrolase protein [Hypoxylon sp. EC38]